jgi:23S rRNA (cytosine1962-C5)-methyltransferase
MFIELLIEQFKPKSVVVRDDGMTREYEGLEDRKGLAYGTESRAAFHEGDVAFEIDLLADQKTGAFLDQYENHLMASHYAKGEAVDMFCYHGGFGLQMAKRATKVTCVDQSELAITRVKDNAKRNGLHNVTGVTANAFDWIREQEQKNARFDTIVIDPPAFAKRKSAVDAAYRGYKDLNMRAMKCLAPGGILISCSCSAKMTKDLFEEMLIDASRDSKRRMLVLERRGASRDHPGLAGVPETEYLKCFVLQAVE